jgi:hypothetical protein
MYPCMMPIDTWTTSAGIWLWSILYRYFIHTWSILYRYLIDSWSIFDRYLIDTWTTSADICMHDANRYLKLAVSMHRRIVVGITLNIQVAQRLSSHLHTYSGLCLGPKFHTWVWNFVLGYETALITNVMKFHAKITIYICTRMKL